MVKVRRFIPLTLVLLLLFMAIGCSKPPTITGINPTSGPSGGGTRITLAGKDFKEGLTVTIGGTPAKDITIGPDGKTAMVTTPGGVPGTVQLIAKNVKNDKTASASFTYEELKVISTTPADGAMIPGDQEVTQISVEFSQAIDSSSATMTVEGIKKDVPTPVTGEASSTGNMITFTVPEPLKTDMSYKLMVSGVKDMAGNVLADYSFGFTLEKKIVAADELVTWYVVQEGDTLPIVAAKPEVYGDENKWTLIYAWNQDEYNSVDGKHYNDIVLNPRRLIPGMTLYIPR